MSGVIIVDGLKQLLPPALRGITEHVIALKDFQVQGGRDQDRGMWESARPPTARSTASRNPTIKDTARRGPTVAVSQHRRQHLLQAAAAGSAVPRHRPRWQSRGPGPLRRTRSSSPPAPRFDVLVRGGPHGKRPVADARLQHRTGTATSSRRRTVATLVSEGRLCARWRCRASVCNWALPCGPPRNEHVEAGAGGEEERVRRKGPGTGLPSWPMTRKRLTLQRSL